MEYNKLTPSFLEEEEIKPYYELVDFALKENDVHYIAITGAYGSGKTSIVLSYEKLKNKKIAYISLANFEPEFKNDCVCNATFENTIEGNIINQLIHQIKPHKIRHSNFNRGKENKGVLSLLVSVVLFSLLILSVYIFYSVYEMRFSVFFNFSLWFCLTTVLTFSYLVICLIIDKLLHKRLLSKMKIFNTEIHLFQENNSLFDNHLYYGTYKDIRKGLHQTKRYEIPEKGFTQISNVLIRDKAISLEAKGLYVLLKHYLDFAKITGEVLGKEDLRYKANTSIHQFNKAWRLLLHNGYLSSTPVYGQNGIAFYEHVIHAVPVGSNINMVAKIEKEEVITTKKRLSKKQKAATKKNIVSDIRANISYGAIEEEYNGDKMFLINNDYDIKDIDKHINLMADYIVSEQPHHFIKTVNINHDLIKETMYKVNKAIICYTIQRCNRKKWKEDCKLSKTYILTSLYNNCTRYLSSDKNTGHESCGDAFIKELA